MDNEIREEEKVMQTKEVVYQGRRNGPKMESTLIFTHDPNGNLSFDGKVNEKHLFDYNFDHMMLYDYYFPQNNWTIVLRNIWKNEQLIGTKKKNESIHNI